MFRVSFQSLSVSLTLLLMGSLPLHAQVVYTENTTSQFGTLNLTTGAYTLIGTTSARIGGFATVGGALYGLGDDTELYRVNTTTASLTPIGSTGITPGGYGLGETSDSTLYATFQSHQLYIINPATATPTFIGNTGFDTDCDLSGDASGNLYDAQGDSGNGFYRINRATGAGTLLATNPWGTVLAITYVQGVMYAINTTGSIYSVNLTTGNSTFVSSYDVNTVGSVFAAGVSATPAAAITPEPGSVALLIGLSITGAGFLSRRRK